MNFFRMMGILFACGLFIKLIGDNVMPRLLVSTARTLGMLSKGVRGTFKSF